MTPSRYYNAFLLSVLTFIMFYFIYLALPKANKIIKPAPSKVIKIALVTPVKEIVKPEIKAKPTPPIVAPIPVKKTEKKKPTKPMIIKKPKPKKIVKKKVVKKKVVKKKIIKKVKPKKVIKKKIVKKKIKPKKVLKQKVVPKPIIEEYIPIAQPVYKEIPTYKAPPVYHAPKPIVAPIIKPTIVAAPQPRVKSDHHKKAFLRNVRSKIIANKKYPKLAKRRHIEGSVKVRFDITINGQVTNIRFINGKRVFQKSIRKTLERTFPMGIPANVQGELPISDVSVVLHFNIR